MTGEILIIVVSLLLLFLFVQGFRYNKADWGHPILNWLDGFNRFLCLRYHRLSRKLIDLPEQGPALLAANHLSGLDPVVLIAASPRPLRFLIAKEQYERFGLQWLFRAVGCIPVDRDRRPERALREAVRALERGEVVALFPQGEIQTTPNNKPLKRGIWKLSELSGAPVYPVQISGVTLPGHVVLSVFVPSKVKLRLYQALKCGDCSVQSCLEQLKRQIEAE